MSIENIDGMMVDYNDDAVAAVMVNTWTSLATCMSIQAFGHAFNNILWKYDYESVRFGRELICALNYKVADQFAFDCGVATSYIEKVKVNHIELHCDTPAQRVQMWNELIKALSAYEKLEAHIMHLHGLNGDKVLYRIASRKRDDVAYVISVFKSFMHEDRMKRNATLVRKDKAMLKSDSTSQVARAYSSDYYCKNGMTAIHDDDDYEVAK